MKTLVRHLEFLLQSHDCVVIPGVGAILCHGESASWDSAAGCWQPPRRVMSFNMQLDRTDGLIAASVSRREGISLAAAATRVNAAAAEMRHILSQEGMLSLGHAGTLSVNEHGATIYEPATAEWLSPSMMWLPTVSISPMETASSLAGRIERENRRRARPGVILRRAAAAAIILGSVVSLGWMVKTALPQAPSEQLASVAPAPARSAAILPGDDRSTLVLVINRHDDASEPVEAVAETAPAAYAGIKEEAPVDRNNSASAVVNNKQTAETVPTLDDDAPYVLVVASLGSMAEAEKYVSNSPFNLGILTVGGRFRVYAATGNSAADALSAKTGNIAAHFPDAWVCRR